MSREAEKDREAFEEKVGRLVGSGLFDYALAPWFDEGDGPAGSWSCTAWCRDNDGGVKKSTVTERA